MKIRTAQSFRAALRLPGDKSITHRAFLFGALAKGVTSIEGASQGDDCTSTRRCLTQLGVAFEDDPASGVIRVKGGAPLAAAAATLDCGNSGTTLRLLMGVLAGSPFVSELAGDASLNRRPMERVARPLRIMGARIDTSNGRPPVRIEGSMLRGADIATEVASAQIKSAILLAGLRAHGLTTVREPIASRDHTERMLKAFGAAIRCDGLAVSLEGPQDLTATHVRIPGDPSSAAPFVVAALIRPDSEVVVDDVLLNPHRVRYIDVLRRMGADIETVVTSDSAMEPTGRIVARSSALRGVSIEANEVPAIVDELPILATAAAYASGRFEVRGASELRVKESDRIKCMVEGLSAMGVAMTEREDGFVIDGGGGLTGTRVESHEDHRIAMALSIAALGARGETEITGAEVVSISLPRFYDELQRGAR